MIETHIKACGFSTVLQYRLWCHRHGFGSGLEKDAVERRAELAASGGAIKAPHQSGPREDFLRGIVERTLHNGRLFGRRPALQQPPPTAESRQALLALMLAVDRHMDVTMGRRTIKPGPPTPMLEGLSCLAMQREHWIRQIEDWQPSPRDARARSSLFRCLARHLLASYDVPAFMDSAWFERGPEACRQQAWYILLAQGGNIRTADTPIRLTRRMAHRFLQAPSDTPLRNLRWAQVVGMGGSEDLARAVVRTRLGRRFAQDDFWRTVVRFLVDNPMLNPAWAGPIVDYLHAMRFSSRRVVAADGTVEEAPPLHPSLSMKGRSVTKLLRQVEAWHAELGRQKDQPSTSWPSCGLREFELVDMPGSPQPLHWSVLELLSTDALNAEGSAMHHCVASYADQCATNETAVFSVGAQSGDRSRESVMTVAVDVEERAITQARGRRNLLPHQSAGSKRKAHGINPRYLELLVRADGIVAQWSAREHLERRS